MVGVGSGLGVALYPFSSPTSPSLFTTTYSTSSFLFHVRCMFARFVVGWMGWNPLNLPAAQLLSQTTSACKIVLRSLRVGRGCMIPKFVGPPPGWYGMNVGWNESTKKILATTSPPAERRRERKQASQQRRNERLGERSGRDKFMQQHDGCL